MSRRITADAPKSTEKTRPGQMINGRGQQGKTETACKCADGTRDSAGLAGTLEAAVSRAALAVATESHAAAS